MKIKDRLWELSLNWKENMRIAQRERLHTELTNMLNAIESTAMGGGDMYAETLDVIYDRQKLVVYRWLRMYSDLDVKMYYDIGRETGWEYCNVSFRWKK